MIVAMRRVRVMQVARDEIVGMLGVRYRRMPACRTVRVTGLVSGASVRRRAVRWILL